MNVQVEKQMYIIEAQCWKCHSTMNVALIKDESKIENYLFGPEDFSNDEIYLAESYNVVIREHYSYTREEKYAANTCPSCNTFVGQHYYFSNYFSLVLYGQLEFKAINLS